uniref:Endoplasmic reticulum transmembrane protein n=1 Tax=Kalanchoe fedtschenkoi TaxID=63787 RepID=A0A7N0UXG5_KALFE
MVLDQAKQRRGPVIVKTVAATLLLVFISTLHSLTHVKKRLRETGSVNPTDHLLVAAHLLEASLMGFSIVLALVVDRFHYFIKQVHQLRRELDVLKKHPESIKRKGKEIYETEQQHFNGRGGTPS